MSRRSCSTRRRPTRISRGARARRCVRAFAAPSSTIRTAASPRRSRTWSPPRRKSRVPELAGTSILVTGGAGFVGSNLVRLLLRDQPRAIRVVDNLLSAERWNVPNDSVVDFLEGSIADDAVLDRIRDEYDVVFHLCTYHGNQSSIHDPLADHEHNQLTTLKLFEHVKDYRRLKRVRFFRAGGGGGEKKVGGGHPTPGGAGGGVGKGRPPPLFKRGG